MNRRSPAIAPRRHRRIAKGFVKATGLSFKKALAILVPPQVLKESSFFGGLNRMSDAIVNLGGETKESESKGKQYVVRKAGGTIADGAIGLALFGMPMTLVTSLFSDGCKVISRVLRDAAQEDRDAADASAFFGDVSKVSNNFSKMFDVPSKGIADDIHISIQEMAERLRREGRMTKELEKDLQDLDALRICEDRDVSEWFGEVQGQLCKIADGEVSRRRILNDVPEIRRFIKRPTVANISSMRSSIVRDLNKRDIPVKKNTMALVDAIVDAIENFSSADFQERLKALTSTSAEFAEKTGAAAGKTASRGARILESLLKVAYKVASLFGMHYKSQLTGAIKKKDCG